MNSALYFGSVRHRRYTPKAHAFRYRSFMVYLDLDELDVVFRKFWFWSVGRPNLAWFKRSDYIGGHEAPIRDTLEKVILAEGGSRPAGPIRVLTQLRTFGYCFNPVSFYYCFDPTGTKVETIVAEITNTPWQERKCYVLTRPKGEPTTPSFRFQFNKTFHVSPFFPMAMRYDWRFTQPDTALTVHMENLKEGVRCFDATLNLKRSPIDSWHLARALCLYPLMTFKVILAIHFEALRLWLKRVPVFDHPQHASKTGPKEFP
jgi:DUF1365 family protein